MSQNIIFVQTNVDGFYVTVYAIFCKIKVWLLSVCTLQPTLQFQVATAYLYEKLKVKIEKEQVWKGIAHWIFITCWVSFCPWITLKNLKGKSVQWRLAKRTKWFLNLSQYRTKDWIFNFRSLHVSISISKWPFFLHLP